MSSYNLYFKTSDYGDLSLALVSHKVPDGPIKGHMAVAGISTMTNPALMQATKWYHECSSKHIACNTALAASKTHLPSRLLRIDENQKYVRLVETREEVIPDSHYSALSHCWGNSDILKLTSLTRDKLKAGIPLELLPKTFIEAIFVARKMTIPYIWIDSLCIVQDSPDDWQSESALMESVYSNSKLNIMATASKNSHEGLSRSRDPRNLQLCLVETKWKSAENDQFYLVEPGSWDWTMTRAPLIKRGWVLQERILSPRSLHFCDDELLWECRELSASETYPTGIPKFCTNTLGYSNVKIKELPDKDAVYKRWKNWVNIYSRTCLTNDSDKLVAISALAKCTRIALNDVYLAGLWKSKFIDQLLWSTAPQPFLEQEYRAPSWSWASVNGTVFMASIYANNEYHIKIDEIKVTPVSSAHDTGSISDGYFRARGFLMRGNLCGQGLELPGNNPDHKNFYVQPDVYANGNDEISVVALPILKYSKSYHDPHRFYSLVLQKKEGSPNGFYTRIGITYSKESFIPKRTRLGNALRELFRKDTDESLYLDGSPGSFIVY
ncbi:Guanine nucleotide-binding protein subunit gamma [Ciborinia camelliae]|nr:Guanine nucleotide-binding protein subunit gamma [Ciborinia camelliae]